MLKRLLATLILLASLPSLPSRGTAQEAVASPRIQEELWALPFPLPMLAFVVKPVGEGPYPLVIMNHGIALGIQERTMFPAIEYRAAAHWFAKRGYFVISPVRYGASSLDDKDQGIFGAVFAHVGSCGNPNFRGPGLAIATLNEWVIDYMSKKKIIQPGKVVVVGQSGGGWGSIALASLNPSSVQAIVTFAAGRGGRVNGKPNNNCAPDKLVAATADFGRTARIPMLWIYAENDTYFGPELTKRMHEAFIAAGGNAEYRVLPAFGAEGHFMIDSPDAVPIWSPLVSEFLAKHSTTANLQQQQQASTFSERIGLEAPRIRVPDKIQYSEWQKLCFDASDRTTICRTTSTGLDVLGQVVTRVDLIERADGRARLQLFVPQGANLQRGVKVSIDGESPTEIPFNWCLSNICVAAAAVHPRLEAALESGKTLTLDLTDVDSSSVALTLALDRFSVARKGAPAQTFAFGLDEE